MKKVCISNLSFLTTRLLHPSLKIDNCCVLCRNSNHVYAIKFLNKGLVGWLVHGVYRHFQPYFTYIVAVSFIGGGNRSTRRKALTCRKSLTNILEWDASAQIFLFSLIILQTGKYKYNNSWIYNEIFIFSEHKTNQKVLQKEK